MDETIPTKSAIKTTWSAHLWNGMLAGAALIVIAVVVFALWYAWDNSSGHTGENVYSILYGAVPALVIALAARDIARGTVSTIVANLFVTSAAFAVALPVYFQYSEILQQYDQWTRDGMPVLSTRALLFRLGLFVVLFIACLVWSVIAPLRKLRSNEQKGGTNAPCA
jgi:hypothetical protein